ncbi:MAG: hypothetical protein IPJ01_10985 [Micavibrio sp.]|nr:hypothetical protein [Micavibrio sp.]
MLEPLKNDNGKFPLDVKLLGVFLALAISIALWDSYKSPTYSYCKSGHWMGKIYRCDTTVTVNKKTGKITKIEF